MLTRETLKSCPFCGGEAEMHEDADGGGPVVSCTGSGPSGFDPAREGHLLLSRVECVLQDVELARRLASIGPEYQSAQSAVNAMRRAERMLVKVFEEMGGITALRALQAIAMEAREGRDGETRLDPKDDSAGRQASPGGSNG